MARLITCGGETGLATEIGASFVNSGSVALVTSTPTPRSGAYCFKYTLTHNGGGRYAHSRIALRAPKSEIFIRAAFTHVWPAGETTTDAILKLLDSAGDSQIYLAFDRVGLQLKAYRGATWTGVLIGTASELILDGQWNLFEIRYVPHSTSGILQVWLNNILAIDFAGNTQATGNANVQFIDLGIFRPVISTVTGPWIAFDDIAVNDTTGAVQNGRCGDGSVLYQKSVGNGNSSQFVGSDGNSADNYALVDEVPPDTADYVASSTPGNQDGYTIESIPAPYNAVRLVQPIAYAALAAPGEGDIRTGVRSGGTDYPDAADSPLTDAYQFIRGDVLYADPADSGAWTIAKTNALEVIVKAT
jgi:hypothetical protein